jgi:hypothetical protein
VLDQLKKKRWDDDFEDIEDDDSIESRNTLLSKDDPQMLQDHLNTSFKQAYTALHDKISTLLETYKDNENIGQMSVYVLRILRDIRSELPKDPSLQFFGLSLVTPLHQNLAALVSADAVEGLAKSLKRKNAAGRALWEGKPELPVQSSPGTVKFLRSLSMAMANMGSDLWSPAAVRVLKARLSSELGARWSVVLEAPEKKDGDQSNGAKTDEVEANGDSVTEEADESQVASQVPDLAKRKDMLTQSLFDMFVLLEVLDVQSDVEGGWKTAENAVRTEIDLEASSRKRLQQGANEFWKRTSLLFGLLA